MARKLILVLHGIATLLLSLLVWANSSVAKDRAIMLMAFGLLVIWVLAGGAMQFKLRDRVKAAFDRVPGNVWLKFFAFCTLMACLEEAVTTGMTNLAPVFGSRIGEAYITASANYFEVIAWFSVVVFLGQFAALALVLRVAAFQPTSVFLMYGVFGLLGEALAFGPQQLLGFAMWICVYGWMVYLPAYCVRDVPGRRPAKLRHAIAAFVLSMLFSGLIAAGVNAVRPDRVGFPEFWRTPPGTEPT